MAERKQMACGHDYHYRCWRCLKCLPCEHEVVEGRFPLIERGWRCPDGIEWPAYGPSSPVRHGSIKAETRSWFK